MTTPPDPPRDHLPEPTSRVPARRTHLRDAVKPIIGSPPDAREHAGWPVVADAETLLRDAGKASRHERRTILVNLAGNGTIRLFCARHVLDEVARQAARYSGRVPVDAFIRRWEADYLPHLNLVDPAAGLLDPGEERRVARLDSPDSAVLALQLGAFFLSTDEPALRAVYGPDADLRRHGEWVAVLGSAGDTGGELLRSVSGVSELAGRGGVAGVKWVWNNVSPWAVAGIAAVAGFSLWTATPEDRRRILRGAGAVAGFVGELAVEHQITSAAFTSMMAPVPAWADLARSVPAEVVRARACLHTLARSVVPVRAPAELAAELPPLPASTSQTAIRATLRRHDCFREVHRGLWRAGLPAGEAWRSPIVGVRPE